MVAASVFGSVGEDPDPSVELLWLGSVVMELEFSSEGVSVPDDGDSDEVSSELHVAFEHVDVVIGANHDDAS